MVDKQDTRAMQAQPMALSNLCEFHPRQHPCLRSRPSHPLLKFTCKVAARSACSCLHGYAQRRLPRRNTHAQRKQRLRTPNKVSLVLWANSAWNAQTHRCRPLLQENWVIILLRCQTLKQRRLPKPRPTQHTFNDVRPETLDDRTSFLPRAVRRHDSTLAQNRPTNTDVPVNKVCQYHQKH